MNQDILKEITNKDYQKIAKSIEKFLAGVVEKTNSNGVVFGLSGGIDSAVVAYLCSHATKENTLAMIMPDTDITPRTETEDALKIIEHTGINYKLLDIKPIIGEYAQYLEPSKRAKGNLRARVRTDILYYYANAKNYLVLGCSDKSEHLMGYFTKFGDGAADITPIISLYKLQVREIATYLGVPQNIISKKSSPYLWEEQTAEGEMGALYEEIDSILYCMHEKNMTTSDASTTTGIDSVLAENIWQACQKSNHKRIPASGPMIDIS
ncbi:MAG: NAD+ synthase [Thaumarchaeota archaeon]|nr:NAD+ synthase [Nitrososphaerota archaeon]